MSLTNKYRPQTLDQVIGQGPIVSSLREVIKARSARAFLFVGPSGVGKTTVARIVARELCDGEATALNIEEIPAADLSGVDDMRGVVNRSLYRAIGASPTKAIILDECHRLSNAAWQVLLKPIEEPPEHVYWFLCTTELGKIPKTILTRCVRYDFKPVEDVLIYQHLCDVTKTEGWKTSPFLEEALEVVAESSGGSVRQSLQFLEAIRTCQNIGEVRAAVNSVGATPEVIDLCRWLVRGQGHTWQEAMKYVKALGGSDAEGTRIVILRYLSAVLANTKSNNSAAPLLHCLSAFSEPYNATDGNAPLLLSLGVALCIGQGS